MGIARPWGRRSLTARMTQSGPCSSMILKELEFRGVHLFISEGHRGTQAAVSKAFLGTSWQMCRVHTTRAVLKNIPKNDQAPKTNLLREPYGNEQRLQAVVDDLDVRGYRTPANTIERLLPGLLSTRPFPTRTRDGYEPPMAWNGSIRNSKEEQRSSEPVRMRPLSSDSPSRSPGISTRSGRSA